MELMPLQEAQTRKVKFSDNKKTTRGSGAHTDIIVASAMAFLQAINRMGEATSRKSPQGI